MSDLIKKKKCFQDTGWYYETNTVIENYNKAVDECTEKVKKELIEQIYYYKKVYNNYKEGRHTFGKRIVEDAECGINALREVYINLFGQSEARKRTGK